MTTTVNWKKRKKKYIKIKTRPTDQFRSTLVAVNTPIFHLKRIKAFRISKFRL